MTAEEFEALFKPGGKFDFLFKADDGLRLANAVTGLDESQRRKLSKTASQFYQRARKQPNAIREQEFGALAVLAVCPLSEACKVDPILFHRYEATAVKILVDRKPEWLAAWIEQKLSAEFSRISWPFLQALIKQGACEKPQSAGYIRMMAYSIGFPIEKHGPKRSERLIAEPHLLEDVWRLFEVETFVFQSVRRYDRHPEHYEDWPATLVALSQSGHLDRRRLLDACRQAIGAEFSNVAITGFIHLHERLEITADEIAAGQAAYLDMLNSRKSHVVTFALELLAGLHKDGRLDDEGFLSSAKGIFGLKPKSQPIAVLSLAGRIVKREPELTPAAVNLAVEALTHESADVQEQAVGLLEAWLPRMHRDHAAEIRERTSGVAATVRGRIDLVVRKLEGEATGPPAGGSELIAAEIKLCGKSSPQSTPDPFPGEVAQRAAALPDMWRRLAGIDEALAAMQEGRLPAPLAFDLLDVPLLSAAEPIQPIQTVDELLDAVAHAIEEIDSADELERILDGISRLCDRRPDDFDLRAAPLLKRLANEKSGDASRGLRFAPLALRRLIHAWLTGQPAAIAGHVDERSLTKFIGHRLNEIEARVLAAQAALLLAAPTHQRGWIDARRLVQRVADWQRVGAEPPKADLIQALLRLEPGQRAEALASAANLTGNSGRAVRWSLGGTEVPTAADFGDFSLWLAAGRSRNPLGELPELSPLINDKLAEALLPPVYSCQACEFSDGGSYRPAGAVPMRIAVYPEFMASPALQMRPTLALSEWTRIGHHSAVTAWGFQWLAMTWPLNLDPYYADGIRLLLGRVNAPASAFEPNYVFLQPLLEPDRPWSEMAYLMAWIALVSKDADSRGAALDAFITAIDDGRADATLAAAVLSRLIPAGWVKLNRLAEAFREISRASPLPAWWTAELLQAFVVATVEWPADIHHVLGLLLELLTDLQLAVTPSARTKLESTKATGKAAQAIKRLLALPAVPASSKREQALAQALDNRLDRAERWATKKGSGVNCGHGHLEYCCRN